MVNTFFCEDLIQAEHVSLIIFPVFNKLVGDVIDEPPAKGVSQ